MFLACKQEDKKFQSKWQQTLPHLNMLLISLCMQFWYTCVIYKCSNCATYMKHLLFIFMGWNTWL